MPSKSVLIAQAFSKTGVLSTVVDSAPSVNTGQVDVATAAELPNTGNTEGDFAFVQATNRLYIWSGSGWYNIALINATPTWDSNGQPASSYELDADSPQTATTITLAASDPEGIPIQYSYVTGGSMDSIATVSQDSSVFTITPKNETQAPDGGTGSITFRATDGVNILPQVSSFTLNFISIIENSRHTTLLATADGTSDNNNITDSSTNNHTITVNGDAYAGTFSPYRSRGYSTYFEDTAANVLYASPSSDFAFGTGAFTISVWVKLLHQWRGCIFDTNDGSNPGVQMSVNNTYLFIHSNTSLSSTSTSSQDVWQHFCWTRDGSGNNKVFVNGTQVTTFTDSTNYTSQNFKMGEQQNGTNDLKAYVKDLHIVKGYAYEPDSTYADGAAEPTTGTVFLGCSLPYHGDKSSSSKTLTVASSGISIANDTPHDYNEYSATDHGGSVYFGGGTREHLSTSLPAFGTQDFEVEFWIYGGALTSNTWYTLFSRDYNVNGSFRIYCSGGSGDLDEFIYIANGTEYNNTSAGKIKDNVWNHILLSRVSGTAKWFINGIADTSWSDSENMTSTATLYIGDTGADETSNSSYPFVGYMSDIAIRMGGSGYRTSSFAPPTATLSSSGTSLHIKGTDASIIDKSQGSNLNLFGNTTGSTTQAKFSNTKSMYFDGSGDRIEIDGPINLGTNPFTYEAWVYTTSNTWIFMTIGNHDGSSSHATAGSIIEYANNNFYMYKAEGGSITGNAATGYPSGSSGPGTVHNQGWKHVAFCRQSNGNHDLYLDGTRIMNYTGWNSQDYGSLDKILIGDYFSQSKPDFSGYLQDVRLTIGTSRYTGSTYTVPTEAFKG